MKYKLAGARYNFTTLVILLAFLAPWTDATACSCGRPPLSDLYKDSTRVFLGEVEKIDLLTKDPVDGQEVTYVATVKPQEIFKGSSNASVRVTFKGKYATPSPPLSEAERIARSTTLDPAFGERTLVMVGGCSFGMAEGKYYIFEKRGEPLSYSGWCEPRVAYETIIVLEFMRGLRDAR